MNAKALAYSTEVHEGSNGSTILPISDASLSIGSTFVRSISSVRCLRAKIYCFAGLNFPFLLWLRLHAMQVQSFERDEGKSERERGR